MPVLLSCRTLSKRWSDAYSLGPIDLDLEGGQVIALHGRNGAGKTTFLSLLTGNLDASAGEVRLEGHRVTPDTADLKKQIGYLPQDPALPRWATGAEILRYAAMLQQLDDLPKRLKQAMDFWDCAHYQHRPLATLSHGMQKRVGLALATLSNPKVLILDEPYSGLDIDHIRAVDLTLRDRSAQGLLTLLSTHVAPYTARHCQRVLLLERGRMAELPGWAALDYLARIDAIEAMFDGGSP